MKTYKLKDTDSLYYYAFYIFLRLCGFTEEGYIVNREYEPKYCHKETDKFIFHHSTYENPYTGNMECYYDWSIYFKNRPGGFLIECYSYVSENGISVSDFLPLKDFVYMLFDAVREMRG